MANVRTPADARREVGKRLRDLRKRQGKTTMDIANALGTTQGNVEAYEAGRSSIRLESLRLWAEALGVEPHTLHDELYPVSFDLWGIAKEAVTSFLVTGAPRMNFA